MKAFGYLVGADALRDVTIIVRRTHLMFSWGPDSSVLRKSSAISDNNGSLLSSLCPGRVRALSSGALLEDSARGEGEGGTPI